MFSKTIILFMLLVASYADDYKRKTKSGIVVGKSLNGFINSWSGIPYAEPPISTLRFKAPMPVKQWSGEKITQTNGNSCEFNEDCLYLNILAPKNSANLPVLIWIHGGKLFFI